MRDSAASEFRITSPDARRLAAKNRLVHQGRNGRFFRLAVGSSCVSEASLRAVCGFLRCPVHCHELAGNPRHSSFRFPADGNPLLSQWSNGDDFSYQRNNRRRLRKTSLSHLGFISGCSPERLEPCGFAPEKHPLPFAHAGGGTAFLAKPYGGMARSKGELFFG